MQNFRNFGKLGKTFLILSILSLFAMNALAQVVKGTVTDQSGEAIMGATI